MLNQGFHFGTFAGGKCHKSDYIVLQGAWQWLETTDCCVTMVRL